VLKPEILISGHTHTLDGLSSVTIANPINGDILKYNGEEWVNDKMSIDELADVTTGIASDGQSLVYSAGTWEASYPVVASELEILSNGESIMNGVNSINFIGTYLGTEVRALANGGFAVNVWIPAPDYASHFNSNDGSTPSTVSNYSTTSRNIASPTSEGNPYKIGDWSAGTLHPVSRSTSISYTTSDKMSLLNILDTTFTATFYDADGVSILGQNQITITENVDVTVSGVRIVISNIETDTNKYKTNINIYFDVETLLPNGGRYTVEMIHDNGIDGVFTKSQTLFYDTDVNSPTIDSITIEETSGQVITRKLSGVEYYTTGSKFTVTISDIDYLNDSSYPSTQVSVVGSEYGLPSFSLGGSSLTDWTNSYDNINSSYIKTDWAITSTSLCSVNNTANVATNWIDWSNGTSIVSTNDLVLINTKVGTSSRTSESFLDESWRCEISGPNFDSDDAKSYNGGWVSDNFVGVNDAVFGPCLQCGRIIENYTTYNPNPGTQPNYSSQSTTVYLVREFVHNGASSFQFTLSIGGNYTSLSYKMANVGTPWIEGYDSNGDAVAYDFGTWNNGNPIGSGGYLSGTKNSCTFNSTDIKDASNTVYVKIGFKNSEKITSLGISFS